jgi:hypothetical protein
MSDEMITKAAESIIKLGEEPAQSKDNASDHKLARLLEKEGKKLTPRLN